jgi:hypothetical protein
MFLVTMIINKYELNLIDYYRVILEGVNYFARFVLAVFLFFDLRKSAILMLQVIILAMAFLNPFIATVIYFIAAFLYKPQKLSA